MAATQADALRAKLPATSVETGDKPRVIIPSPLVLTKEQEDNLCSAAARRRKELEDELGRIDYTASSWVSAAAANIQNGHGLRFFAQRHLAHLVYHMEMEWRKWMIGGLFNDSNLHLPLIRRTVQQQIARAVAYFFGTSPWFSASPKPDGDEWNQQFAAKCDRWAKHEATESSLESTLANTIKLAFIQGEQVTKAQYERQVSYYKQRAVIAIKPDGEPFLTVNGDYVFDHDRFVPPKIAGTNEETTKIQPAGSQRLVLERDMQTPQPDYTLKYDKRDIERSLVHFSGARTINIHFMDFLCPLTAPDVQRAADCYHIYSEPLISLCSRLLQDTWTQQNFTPEQQVEAISKLANQLTATSTNSMALPASEKARPELKESVNMQGKDRMEPEIVLVESWHHFDVNNDGALESVVLLMDRETSTPLYYDYAANVTPDGLRPFTVHRINEVAGRWHGQGQVETLYPLQLAADIQLNRWNFSQMSAARVDLWSPENTVEGQKNPGLKLNWGRAYRKKDPKIPASEILDPVYLRDIKGSDLQQLLQTITQMVTNMGGVANANDAAMAGLDTSDLATGILDIQKSGEELFGLWIQELSPGIKSALKQHITLTLAHIDAPRVYRYFDYDDGAQQMVQKLGDFQPQDAQDLELDFTLELTRYRGQTEFAQADQAMTTAVTFYAQSPIVQQRIASLAVQKLRAAQIRNADRIIVPMTSQEWAATPMPGQPTGMPQQSPPAPPPKSPTAPDFAT